MHYITALLKINHLQLIISLRKCQRIQLDTMTGEWEDRGDSDMLVSGNIPNILGESVKTEENFKLLAKQANYQ